MIIGGGLRGTAHTLPAYVTASDGDGNRTVLHKIDLRFSLVKNINIALATVKKWTVNIREVVDVIQTS